MADPFADQPPGPTLIGIGAQKCASSWLHMALGAHPMIGVATPKELDFFSYHYDRGGRWYRGFFRDCADRPVRAEISPSYLHDPRAPGRAARFDPGLGILVALRDPVARAFSNHLHEIRKGHIPPCSFADGLCNNPAYLEQSLYARHLDRWLDAFPRARLHLCLTEDIAADPMAAARDLYAFAGMPDAPSDLLAEQRNVSDQPRWPRLRRALRRGGDGLRRLGYEHQLARIKALPPVDRLLAANSRNLADLVPPMDADSRARLEERLAPDLDRLAALLGRDSLPWPTWERTR